MRILLAARHSPIGQKHIGGVQSWSRAVGSELLERGHEVTYWEPGLTLSGIFDIGLIANVCDAGPVVKFCKRHLTVSHGIIEPERPSAKHVAFTSEEVRKHWNVEGPVIRQPIDLSFWTPGTEDKKFLTRFSYRHGLLFVPHVAKKLRLQYTHIGTSRHDVVRNLLRQSACVLATGRAALEAMACGVPVVLCDDRSSYQAALMDLSLEHAMHHNYSGRGGIAPTEANVLEAVQQAMEKGGNREHVERWHDSRVIVDELLEAAA